MIYCKAEKCKSFFRKFHDCTVPRTERLENVTLACAVRRGCVRQAPEQQLLQAALPSFFERRMRKESDFMLWREDRPMRIALLGCGTVGGGVYEFVQERTDMEIAYVLSRRPRPELNCPVTSDFSRIVSDPTVDTAIEVMGGRQPAYEYMCAALRAGKNVVTANKQLMSERYGELVQLARENHVALRCSAAVGGGIRWLTNLESTLDMEPVLRVSGIMNGTTNYILDTMTTSGLKFEDALRQAQALGYAEVDPTEDLNGADARRKLVISTNVAFGCVVQEPEVTTFGIAGIRACDIGAARKMHRVVKLMASARLLDSGDVACYLEPAMMPQGMHEAAVPENFNLISITGMHIGKQSFYGQGAGRFPTAYNVMQDCLDIRNGLTRFYTDKLRPARVVVVSAAGKRSAGDNKITDLLYLCYAHLQYGVSCDGIYQMIRERYGDIHRELGLRVDLEGVLDRLRSQMEQGISRDELVSRGEYLSALLMADYLGFTFVDAAQWLFFHYDGTIDQEKSYAALRALAKDKCVVIPGFYGLMPDGKLRTLTRGGSDITGALAAAALDADVYENWTDVSGILMADPRIVDHPRSIERATYSELRQLSYSGAQVLHEMTIFPVREKNIPLNIRNTNEPDHPGTLITESFVEAPNPERFVTGIAGKCDFSIVTVSKKGLSGAVGTLRAILEVFENNSIPVAHTPSGIDCISLAMPTEALTPNQYSLLDELRSEIRPDSIQINDHIAVIAVVGRKMAFRVGTSGKIFAALGKAGINIRMISQGPDEQAIILGVDNKDYADAIRVLYNAFVK